MHGRQPPLDSNTDTRFAHTHTSTAVSDCVRTSLGPRGMDKMIRTKDGETIITNDGATILKHLGVMHPAARMVRLVILLLALLPFVPPADPSASSSSLHVAPKARRPLGGPGRGGRRRDDIGRRPRGKHARSSREAAGKGHPPDHHCGIVCKGRKEGRAVPRGALHARRAQ